jgi:hypothetical protein
VRAHRSLAALIALVGVLAAAGVATGAGLARDDGTLAVQLGRGTFTLQISRGSVIGRLDRGKLIVEDQSLTGGTRIVRGWDWIKRPSVTTTTFGGKDIRFRILGGRFTVRVQNATGLAFSAVGRGRVTLKGAGLEEFGLSNGEYSLNGEEFLPVPDEPLTLQLRAPGPARASLKP